MRKSKPPTPIKPLLYEYPSEPSWKSQQKIVLRRRSWDLEALLPENILAVCHFSGEKTNQADQVHHCPHNSSRPPSVFAYIS